jgi:hypothetical protein
MVNDPTGGKIFKQKLTNQVAGSLISYTLANLLMLEDSLYSNTLNIEVGNWYFGTASYLAYSCCSNTSCKTCSGEVSFHLLESL